MLALTFEFPVPQREHALMLRQCGDPTAPTEAWGSCLISQLLKTSQVDSNRSLLIYEIEIPLELCANWKGKHCCHPSGGVGMSLGWQWGPLAGIVWARALGWAGWHVTLQLIMGSRGWVTVSCEPSDQFYRGFSATLGRCIKGKWLAWRQALDA